MHTVTFVATGAYDAVVRTLDILRKMGFELYFMSVCKRDSDTWQVALGFGSDENSNAPNAVECLRQAPNIFEVDHVPLN